MVGSRVRSALAAIAAIAAMTSCVTVNVYFPEAAIKDLSKQIEEQVQKKAAQGAQPAPSPSPEPQKSTSSGLLDDLLGVTPAYAGDVAAPEVSSPAIRKIIDSRAARVADLDRYKAQGVIGENNQGLVEARALETIADLKARAEVQRLVKAENADREALYREIAAAKGVDAAQIPKIRETYASTLRDNAKPGEWIQLADGTWKKK